VKGKRLLIVGGTSGVGLALAKRALAEQAEVLIASRTAHLQKHQLETEEGLVGCQFFPVDITVESSINHLLADVGAFDHLIITVKSPLVVSPFLELDSADVKHAFDTKFWGQYQLAKLAFPSIKHGGSITFSSGTLGNRPYEGFSTMSVISGAVESLCKALAIELSPIRVNVVSPGFKTLTELEDKIPLGLGSDAQIANPYFFLINDSYITGATIVSDGGAMLV